MKAREAGHMSVTIAALVAAAAAAALKELSSNQAMQRQITNMLKLGKPVIYKASRKVDEKAKDIVDNIKNK